MKYIIVIGCFLIVVLLGIQLARDEERKQINKEAIVRRGD